MDGSYDETVREVEEECGILRSRVRFQPEKKQRIEESLAGTKIEAMREYHKGLRDSIVTKEATRIWPNPTNPN